MESYRYERVIIETTRHRIEGTITLARDGYRSRLSDVLNATERDFLSLTDATISTFDGADAAGDVQPFVVVSRHQIVIAIPQDPNARPSTPPPPLTAV